MTITQLNSSLTQALKSYIKSSNHNETGKLHDSIDFNCTADDKGNLSIKFNAMEYIHYLDKGEFISNFFDLSSTQDLIAEFTVSSLLSNLNETTS